MYVHFKRCYFDCSAARGIFFAQSPHPRTRLNLRHLDSSSHSAWRWGSRSAGSFLQLNQEMNPFPLWDFISPTELPGRIGATVFISERIHRGFLDRGMVLVCVSSFLHQNKLAGRKKPCSMPNKYMLYAFLAKKQWQNMVGRFLCVAHTWIRQYIYIHTHSLEIGCFTIYNSY